MQALRPAPALEDAAGELVDDLHLAVDHRVVDVALVQRLGAQRLVEVVDEVAVLGAVEVVDAEEALGLGDALLHHRHRLVLLVEFVVEVGDVFLLGARIHPFGGRARRQAGREAGELDVQVGRLFGGAGDDQRRARLVDQDVVDLVHDREGVAALHLFGEILRHVVAQVVEAELRVGAVHHVAGVRAVLLVVGLHVLQHPHRESQSLVDRAHPFGVAAGEVVVDGDQVHALAGQRVERHRERGRERLALAGLHLRDAALVQRHRADQLHVEVAHPHLALAGLAHDREALGEERVEILPVRGALAQRVDPLAQLRVAVVFELGLERADQRDALLVLLELLRLADVEGAIQDGHAPRVATEGWRRRP